MSRIITSAELTTLRADGYRAKLHLGIWQPETVFAAQVNQTFSTHDSIVELTYDSVTSGAYTDIVGGMVAWIGSSAGARDLGLVRVRKAATSSKLYIAQTSRVAWADNLYITVVDDFPPLPKLPYGITDSAPEYMDYDVAYSDQHANLAPVPVLGPALTPLMLTGASVEYAPDASASWALGSSIASYSWWVTGGATVINETTSQPTFAFSAAGQYRIYCTVTAANGKSTTGTRPVIVFDENNPPIDEFELQSCEGNATGWAFSALVRENLANIQENALCALFAEDDQIAADAQNPGIVAIGWIAEESITLDPVQGSVSFTALGTSYWLEKLTASPVLFADPGTTPANWTEFDDLTVDKALWHVLYWQSTACAVLDIHLSDDTRITPALEGNGTNLLEQVNALAARISAITRSDRYGALWIEIDQNLIAESDRSALPVSMEITSQDWVGSVTIQRSVAPPISMVDISGVSASGKSYYARAYGETPAEMGSVYMQDEYIVSTQDDLNEKAGLLLGQQNNPYPVTRLDMAHHQRVIDIAPRQYVEMSLAASENERGIVWADKKLIPRRISLRFDPASGDMPTKIEYEAETLAGLAMAYDRPQTPLSNFAPTPADFNLDDFALEPFGSIIDNPSEFTPQLPTDEELGDIACPTDAPANGAFDLWFPNTQMNTQHPSCYSRFPCTVRSSAHANQTRLDILGTFESRDGENWAEDTTDTSWYTVYGRDGYNRILTGSKSAITEPKNREFTFSPAANTEIDLFEIALSGGDYLFDPAASSGSSSEAPVLSEHYNFYPYGTDGIKANFSATWTKAKWYYADVKYSLYVDAQPNIPISQTAYFDISWQITILGRNPDGLRVEIYKHKYNHELYTDFYEKTFSGYPIGSGSQELSGFYFIITPRYYDYNYTFPVTPSIVASFTVTPTAGHRIRYDNAVLYNVCPKAE